MEEDTKKMQEDAADISKNLEEGKKSLCIFSLDLFKSVYSGSTQTGIDKNTATALDVLMEYEAVAVLWPIILP